MTTFQREVPEDTWKHDKFEENGVEKPQRVVSVSSDLRSRLGTKVHLKVENLRYTVTSEDIQV